MILTILKSTFPKAKPKQIVYRKFKNFDLENFLNEIRTKMQSIDKYETFEEKFLKVLNKHAPLKKKFIRANHVPYMTKNLCKAIMKRSQLENKYIRNSAVENMNKYKKHKNFCSKLYKKERKKFYSQLDIKNITDNKLFWKTMKPFLSDKCTYASKISLVRNDNVISDDQELAVTFNNFFEQAVDNLGIQEYQSDHNVDINSISDDPTDYAITKYKYTINHELLIGKLYAYGFSKDALKLINSYMSDRWQKTKIDKSFSSWSALLKGVPQGSVLGPILFNINLNYLFYFLHCDICNFADDTTLYVCDKNLNFVMQQIEQQSNIALKWFEDNNMKMNSGKCYLFVSGNKHENMWAKIGDDQIWESRTVKLLGITIDNELKFDEYISNVCKKAQRKLTVLTRIKKYPDFNKLRLLFKTFFDSQFKYCPLTWMFHSRTTSNKINKLHERALRLVYADYGSTFEELLEKDHSFTVHHYNIQTLCIELYKVFTGQSQTIFSDLFERKNISYSLRSQPDFAIPQVKTVYKGSNSLRYFGPIIWSLIPKKIKSCDTLASFISNIRQWRPDACPCRICKNFIPDVGLIETY